MTRDEALGRAIEWAAGRRSTTNMMMRVEPGPEHRQQTLVAIAQADAAEVARWAALVPALTDIEVTSDRIGRGARALLPGAWSAPDGTPCTPEEIAHAVLVAALRTAP